MADTAVLLNIGEMIDLAIGTPEVGVVDFCMLHTVLHCLAQQIRCLDKNVELRGSVGTLPLGKPEAPQIAVNEFIVDTSGEPGKVEIAPAVPTEDKETMLIVERIKRTPSSERGPSGPSRRPADGKKSGGTASKADRDGVKGHSPSTEKLSLVTVSRFNVLEDAVDDLKNRVYGSIPKNEDILEGVRSQTNMKSITDMWTSLNVSSRLEAAEEGLAKLSSLVQDLIGETAALQNLPGLDRLDASDESEAPGTADTKTGLKSAKPGITFSSTPISIYGELTKEELESPATKADMLKALAHVQKLRNDLDNLNKDFHNVVQKMGIDPGSLTGAGGPGATGVAGVSEGPDAISGPGSTGMPGTPVLPGQYGQPGARDMGEEEQQLGAAWPTNASNLLERLNALEKKLNICCDTIKKTDGVVHDQLSSFQDQIDYLAKQVHTVTEDLISGKIPPEFVKDLEGMMQLFQTVQDMQNQLAEVHDTALQLATEKDDRQQHLQSLLEQIELLKMIKLDREDMEEALAEKADLRMLSRKVSHDQFEMACDDLSKGLENAVGKLNVQESLWQQALDDIQREIENKLDKMELSPLKNFFFNKLKKLQENLKQMAALRREVEAAGTKKRLLTDVNCLSCDAKAVMNMDATAAVPTMKPLPATMSMKPYLSYELDTIRKAQASNLPQRNMHDWETIEKHRPHPKQLRKARSDSERHLCNRYCGGSHTVTTPAQRVARLGHFIKQWGPEVLPLSSGLATGDDGRLYKVSAVEGANVGPGGAVENIAQLPKATFKKAESPKPSKPLIITEECRCLDDDFMRPENVRTRSH